MSVSSSFQDIGTSNICQGETGPPRNFKSKFFKISKVVNLNPITDHSTPLPKVLQAPMFKDISEECEDTCIIMIKGRLIKD